MIRDYVVQVLIFETDHFNLMIPNTQSELDSYIRHRDDAYQI